MKITKLFKWLHRWLGLCLCLTVLSISLSGVLLVWKKEYLWLSLPDARENIIKDTESIAQTIEKISSNYAKNELLLIQIHSENLSLHKAYIDQGKRAWFNQHGEIVDQWSNNGRFEDWLVDLHHRFLLGNVGLNIAGFTGLLLLPMLLLGLIIWWPHRSSLKLGVLPTKLNDISKGELIMSHSNLGFITFIPILIICITGVILTYPTQSREFLVDPFSETDDYLLSEGPVDSLYGEAVTSWSQVFKRALDQYPDATIRWVTPSSSFTPYRVIGLEQTSGWNRSGKTTIYIDSTEGYMDVNINDLLRPKVERLYDFTYPIHTAKFGLWYRLLLSLIGLSLFIIALFGCKSFFKK